MMAHVTYTSIMTLATVQGKLTGTAPQYIERIDGLHQGRPGQRDIRITQCITDAKGDRSRPPSRQDDPDAYVHVVDRSPDGVVIRGAKLHITAASLGHDLMTIPTKSMKAGEEEYAIAAMVPVNAPGVKIINTTYAPAPRGHPRLPGVGQDATRPRASSSSTTCSCPTSASSSTARSPAPRCSPTRSACGSASAASPAWPTAPT